MGGKRPSDQVTLKALEAPQPSRGRSGVGGWAGLQVASQGKPMQWQGPGRAGPGRGHSLPFPHLLGTKESSLLQERAVSSSFSEPYLWPLTMC